MHGRKKQDEWNKSQEQRDKESMMAQKASAIIDKILSMQKESEWSLETLEWTTKVAMVYPEFPTAWNLRRKILLQQKPLLSQEQFFTLIHGDLEVTQNALQKHHKAYSLWYHRRWVIFQLYLLSTSPSHSSQGVDLEREIALCIKFLSIDERNFHCWNYFFWLYFLMQRVIYRGEETVCCLPRDTVEGGEERREERREKKEEERREKKEEERREVKEGEERIDKERERRERRDELKVFMKRRMEFLIEKDFSNFSAWRFLYEFQGNLILDDKVFDAILMEPRDETLWQILFSSIFDGEKIFDETHIPFIKISDRNISIVFDAFCESSNFEFYCLHQNSTHKLSLSPVTSLEKTNPRCPLETRSVAKEWESSLPFSPSLSAEFDLSSKFYFKRKNLMNNYNAIFSCLSNANTATERANEANTSSNDANAATELSSCEGVGREVGWEIVFCVRGSDIAVKRVTYMGEKQRGEREEREKGEEIDFCLFQNEKCIEKCFESIQMLRELETQTEDHIWASFFMCELYIKIIQSAFLMPTRIFDGTFRPLLSLVFAHNGLEFDADSSRQAILHQIFKFLDAQLPTSHPLRNFYIKKSSSLRQKLSFLPL